MPRVNATRIIVERIKKMPATVFEICEDTGFSEVRVRQIVGVLETVGFLDNNRDPSTKLFRYHITVEGSMCDKA